MAAAGAPGGAYGLLAGLAPAGASACGALELCGAFAGFCLAASWVSGDHSFVDRLWSVTPAVYAWLAAAQSGWHPRPLLMAGLATAWGLRLTFNFYRKGGYRLGEEDYPEPQQFVPSGARSSECTYCTSHFPRQPCVHCQKGGGVKVRRGEHESRQRAVSSTVSTVR